MAVAGFVLAFVTKADNPNSLTVVPAESGLRSSGGHFSLSGHVGNTDAAAVTGGTFRVVGGVAKFTFTVPLEQGPTLGIVVNGPETTLSWPIDAAGYTLQWSPVLSPPRWQDLSADPGNRVTISTDGVENYFRLIRH
jgi:hypothetical protein